MIDRQVDELVRRASKALRKDSLLRHWSILLMVKKVCEGHCVLHLPCECRLCGVSLYTCGSCR